MIKDLVMCWQSLGLPSQGDYLSPGGPGLHRSPSNSTTPTFLCCSLSCPGARSKLSESLCLGSGHPEFPATLESHYHDFRPRWALSLGPGVAWELEVPNEPAALLGASARLGKLVNGCALPLFQSLALATATATLHLETHLLTYSSL